MKINRKLVAIAAAVVVVAAGGVGIAYAVGGGESDEQITGPSAKKAEAAALDAVGGGTVLEAEHQEAGGSGVYEVEVQRPDGSQVEVLIDDQFQPSGPRRMTTPARRTKARRTRAPRAPRTSSRRSPSRTPPSDQESGIEMRTTVAGSPEPATVARPPCAVAIACTIARPRPAPRSCARRRPG